MEPELLILDEAGMQRGTDEEKNILFEIIDARYEMSRPTILTTNLALPALEEMVGERVIDRLREGNGRMVEFEWESHRRGQAGVRRLNRWCTWLIALAAAAWAGTAAARFEAFGIEDPLSRARCC